MEPNEELLSEQAEQDAEEINPEDADKVAGGGYYGNGNDGA